MNKTSPQIYLSEIDQERFGVRAARATTVTCDNLPDVIDFCQVNKVKFLIARCLTSELSAAQAMETQGFFLTGTLVYYQRNLFNPPIPSEIGRIPIRPLIFGDENKVKAVAAEAFYGYYGHYHADKNLDPRKCDEVYADWAIRACTSSEVADDVLVADSEGIIVGFAALKLKESDKGEGVLFGVTPAVRGQGIYRSLIIHGMYWCLSKGATIMIYSAQLNNNVVQKVLPGLGFEISNSYYTFHKWFDIKD